MLRAILFAVFWSLTTAMGVAQEPLAPAVATPANDAPAPKPAIVLIIAPNARQSEVVKQVVEALEKAGIAKADSPDKVTPSTSAIHVTLSMRADESYEKIKHLVEALQAVGVEQLSFQAGGVQEAGKEAQNHIRLIAQPNYTTEELHRIEQAITASAKQSGLTFVLSTQIPGQENAPAYDPSATPAIEPQSVPPEPPVNVPQTKETPDPDYEKIVILRIEGGPEHYAMLRPLETALGKLRIALAPVDLSVNKPDGKDDFHVDLAMRTEESPENIAKLIGWLTELKVYDFTLSTKENPTNVVLIQVWNETVAVQHLIESLQEASKSPVKFNFVRRDQPKSQDPSLTRKNNQEIATSVADALKKVKLAGSKGIEIRLQDGVCTLAGEVASDADVALAGDVAGIVMGVTTVKNQLTSKVVQNKDDTSEVKVFALQHAQATEVAEVLKQVYDKGPAKIVPDARTNSVIVTGPEAQLQEIEALLLKLDEGGQANPNARSAPVDPAQSEAAKLVVQLQEELAQLQQSVGANHPKAKELQARIAAARQNVQPETASSLPGTPATNVNPLGEIAHLDAEGERLRERLEADKQNLERSQVLMKEHLISVQKAQEAEAPVRVSEALLAAHEAQRSAVLQKFKAQLLKALDDALEYFQSSGQIEKAELQDAEKQIEAIITQVDNSPQQALTAANDLISQLDSALVKQLEKALESSPTDPKSGTWQTALRQAQRRARTRKLLPGSLLSDRDFLDGAKALSSTESVAWTSIVNEIISELEKEREAEIERNLGKHSPRVDDLNAFIAQIKAANTDHFATAANEQAKAIAELKETDSLFSVSLAKGRAEREQLLTTDPTNPRIRELDEEIATVTVMQRNYAKAIAAAEAGAGSKLPASAPLGRIVIEGSPQELQLQIAQLRKEYEAADSEARQLARQLQTTPDEAQKNEAQKADLRRAVQRAFTARQSLLRAELLEMHDKLLKTQRSIDLRERISDQIIQRRVEDLLNPQLKWEGEFPSVSPSPAMGTPQTTSRPLTTELEGKWHGLSMTNLEGIPLSVPLCNVTVQGDRWTNSPSLSPQIVAIDAERKTVRFSNTQPSLYQYELSGDRLTMKSESIIMTLARGHDPALDRIVASRSIPKGLRLFTFSTNDTHTHAGLLRPGDRVDVTVTFVDRKGIMVTKVLLECIEVFATENKTVHSEETQNDQRPRSVSLLVTPEQDGFVKLAQMKGQLGFSLRHPDDEEVKNPKGINAAIMEELQRSIGEDDRSLPLITSDQETRWRSAVVEILVSGKSDVPDQSPRKVGFGVIVAADGTMLSHMGGGWSSTIKDWPNIDAQFDDGSIVPLQIVDAGGSGFVVLRPKQSVNLNHHFPLSGTTTGIGDQVYVGWMIQTSPDRNYYRLSATTMPLAETDRRVASLGEPVWQLALKQRIPNSLCHPVLSKDGELLAITLTDTGELLLAMPVDKLREILPQSVGKLPVGSTAIRSVPDADGGADLQSALLAQLQGDWSFRGQPIDKDEPQGLRTDVNIKGDLMTFKLTLPDGRQGEASHQIKLGRAGPPQQIDVIFDPNEGTQRMECKGIIEIDAEVVRICLDNSSDSQRPEVFAAGSNAEIWELRRKPSEKPASPAASTPSDPQTAMQAKLQGTWHLTIHPTSVLGTGLFLKDSEEAEAVIEGQVMKVFYKKALGANLLEDDRDPFLAYTVKVTFGETGSPQPVDLLFGPNEEPVNRRLALGIAEFSDDVIRLCFDRATESESIRPEVFAVGAKGEIWELRREPPTGSRGYVLDRLQGVWQGTWQPDFTLPADVDVPTIDGIVRIQGSRMAVSWQPDEEIEVRLGASGSAQNIDLLFKDRKTKATNELLGVVDVSGEEIILRLGDCNEEDRPKSIVGTKDEATFTLKLSKLPPGTFQDLGAQCELAGPLPQGAGQGKFRGGLRIAKVFAGTPAAQGGLAAGDILVGFHVWEITRLEELQYALAQKLKGEVSFHVIRRGVVRKGYVLLDGSRRPDTDAELSPDQLTSIPVEYDRGIAIPVAQLQKVIPKAQEQQQEKPGDSNPPTVEPDPRDNAGSQDSRLSPLQGRWKVDFFVSPNRAEQWERVEIEGSTLTCFGAIDEKSGFTRVYRLTLGSSDDPRAVDLQETEGNQTFPGLIEKTRDGLALCLGLDGKRPTEFGDGDQRICLRLIPQPAEPEPSPAAADPKASSQQ